MSGTDSEYPAAIDPEPVTLRGGHDFLTLSALQWALAAVTKIQNEVGFDPTLFTGIGAIHYGLISTFMESLFRIEGGTANVNGNNADIYPVTFTADRFTAPPMVVCQYKSLTSVEPTPYGKYNAKNITKEGFELGSHYTGTHLFTNEKVYWIAFQAPFGIEGQEG